jgi:hypothetical protein
MSGCYGRCSSCLAASIIDATTHSTCPFPTMEVAYSGATEPADQSSIIRSSALRRAIITNGPDESRRTYETSV